MHGGTVWQRFRALALAGMVGALVVGGASPAEGRRLSPGPTVDLGNSREAGPRRPVDRCRSHCLVPRAVDVVKAVVSVSQPQASGEGSFPLTCIGSARPFTVIVHATGSPFELGETKADAFVLIKRGRTDQAEDSQVVHVDPTVFVDVADTAQLLGSGEDVSIDVTAACPVGAIGQQSYVNVSQGQANGNGSYVPACDGQPHTFDVTVQASQERHQLGSAQTLSFAFVEAGGQSSRASTSIQSRS